MRALTHLILASVVAFGVTGEVLAENPTAPIRIRGYCVDEQGKGIEGAEVFLAEYALEHRRLAQTTSGPDGLFEFVDVVMPYKKAEQNRGSDRGMFQVFGLADGLGVAWLPISRFDPNPPMPKVVPIPVFDVSPIPLYYGGSAIDLKLEFPKAQTLSGRVVDDQGKPIAGASLTIRYCDREANQADYSRTGGPSSFEVLNETEIVPPDVKTRTTDEDGRFKFSALPPECRFQVDIRTPGRFRQSVWLSTRKDLKADVKGTPIFIDGAEIALPRTLQVPLHIVCGDSRDPAEKVLLIASNRQGSGSGVTDLRGRVELSLPTGAYSVQLVPRTGTAYLPTRASMAVSENAPADVTQIAMDPAAVVEVSVTDAATGKGLAGVDLGVVRDGKLSLQIVWSYEPEEKTQHFERPRTNADGKIRALFTPGKHRIGIALEARPPGYRVVEPLHQDIECRTGEPTRVKFQMTQDPAAP